jgi:hypothetical protein
LATFLETKVKPERRIIQCVNDLCLRKYRVVFQTIYFDEKHIFLD